MPRILFFGRDGWEMLEMLRPGSDWSTLRPQPGQGPHSALYRFGIVAGDFPGGEPVAGHYRLLDSGDLDCSVVGPFATLEDALK
jgi:hypothetical protein